MAEHVSDIRQLLERLETFDNPLQSDVISPRVMLLRDHAIGTTFEPNTENASGVHIHFVEARPACG